MKSRIVFIIAILTAPLLFPACHEQPVTADRASNSEIVIFSRPRSLDAACGDDAFPLTQIRSEVRNDLNGVLLASFDDPFVENGSTSIQVPADVPLQIVIQGFGPANEPLLLGEARQTFSLDLTEPLVIPLVPHPQWTQTAATLVPRPPDTSGAYQPVSLHFRVTQPLTMLWAVLAWNSDEFEVNTGSFNPTIANVIWIAGLIDEPELVSHFCEAGDCDRALGVLLMPRGGGTLDGFYGFVGDLTARPRQGITSASLILSAAGYYQSPDFVACLDAPDVRTCLDGVAAQHGGYDSLFTELNGAGLSLDCTFNWNYQAGARP